MSQIAQNSYHYMPTWTTPTSHETPTTWTDPQKAYNSDESDYAWILLVNDTETEPLVLIHTELLSDRVRFKVISGIYQAGSVRVEIYCYREDAWGWLTVWEDIDLEGALREVIFGGPYPVTKIRFTGISDHQGDDETRVYEAAFGI